MPPRMPSFAGDPVYAQAKLIANRDLNEVLQQALQRQSQLFLGLGNPALAQSVFSANTFLNPKGPRGGPGKGQLTQYERAQIEATRQAGLEETGTSTMAKIAREHTLQQRQLNDQMNAANLFYSGARAKGLGDLARNRQFSEFEAFQQAQMGPGGLNEIMDMILGARQKRRGALAAAAEAAYNRLLAEQLASA